MEARIELTHLQSADTNTGKTANVKVKTLTKPADLAFFTFGENNFQDTAIGSFLDKRRFGNLEKLALVPETTLHLLQNRTVHLAYNMDMIFLFNGITRVGYFISEITIIGKSRRPSLSRSNLPTLKTRRCCGRSRSSMARRLAWGSELLTV